MLPWVDDQHYTLQEQSNVLFVAVVTVLIKLDYMYITFPIIVNAPSVSVESAIGGKKDDNRRSKLFELELGFPLDFEAVWYYFSLLYRDRKLSPEC